MLNLIFKITDFFSPYANSFEKKLDKFLSKITPQSHRYSIEKKVRDLMQEDLVAFHLWTERRYKGYLYLHKRKRRELYSNTQKILEDFRNFQKNHHIDLKQVRETIEELGVPSSHFDNFQTQLEYLCQIMAYFNPNRGSYVYRESSNFGGLLSDPTTEKLVGDCNQIVTLYTYFFSLKFDINDLQIKTPHQHVCLHFKGIDIEATNGQFAHYSDVPRVLPITELMSVNLLDTTDSYVKTHPISPESLLESSKLAFLLSSNEDIVKNNLNAAFNNLIRVLVAENKFDIAFDHAQQSHDKDLINFVAHNAVVYNLNRNNFTVARRFLSYLNDPKLTYAVDHAEAIKFFNNKKYDRALSIFRKINDDQMIKKTYAAQAIALQSKLANIKTVDDLRKKSSTLYKMRDLANKSGDNKLIEHVDSMLKQI